MRLTCSGSTSASSIQFQGNIWGSLLCCSYSLRQQNPCFLFEMHYKSLHTINIGAVARHKKVAGGKCFFLQLHLQREHEGWHFPGMISASRRIGWDAKNPLTCLTRDKCSWKPRAPGHRPTCNYIRNNICSPVNTGYFLGMCSTGFSDVWDAVSDAPWMQFCSFPKK